VRAITLFGIVVLLWATEGCHGPTSLRAHVVYETWQLPPGEQPRLGQGNPGETPYKKLHIMLTSEESEVPTPAPASFRPREVTELVLRLTQEQMAALRRELENVGFFMLPNLSGVRPSITFHDSTGEWTVSKAKLRATKNAEFLSIFGKAERVIMQATGVGWSAGAGVR